MKFGTIEKFSRALHMFTALGNGCTCALLITSSEHYEIFRKIFLNISAATTYLEPRYSITKQTINSSLI